MHSAGQAIGSRFTPSQVEHSHTLSLQQPLLAYFWLRSRTPPVVSDPLGTSQSDTRTQHVKGCASGGGSTATLDLPACECPFVLDQEGQKGGDEKWHEQLIK